MNNLLAELEEFFQWKEEKPIVPIHELTLSEFISPGGVAAYVASEDFCNGPGARMIAGALYRIEKNAPYFWQERKPTNINGFTIAHCGDDDAGMIFVWREEDAKVVGGLANCIPYVLPEFRGQKLGREIDLLAWQVGIKRAHYSAFFSPEGLATRFSTHRFAVEQALREGLNVPQEVLADYPELNREGKI